MRNEIKLFENEELNLKVRTIKNPDGSLSVNAEDVAIGFGWIQTQSKSGKEYVSVRWERMNGFSSECGFPHEWGKDDYIPESLFYMLGFKAGNEKAQKYQQWLAMDVLPTLRKTGTYTTNTSYQYSLPAASIEAAANAGRLIERIMKLEGSSPHEIAMVINSIFQQAGIELPDFFVKIPAWEQIVMVPSQHNQMMLK